METVPATTTTTTTITEVIPQGGNPVPVGPNAPVVTYNNNNVAPNVVPQQQVQQPQQTQQQQDKMNITTSPNSVISPNPLMQTAAIIKGGEVPNNLQLTQTIESTKLALDEVRAESTLSDRGQKLLEDAKNVLDSAARMLNEKNHDERMQRIIHNSIAATKETKTGVNGSNMPIGKEDFSGMKNEAREMFYAAKDVAIFSIRSGQFRDVLLEILDLFQSILRTAQDKIAQNSEINTNLASQMKHETYVTEDDKQSLFGKFKMLVTRLGSRPEYYNAIEHLFIIADQMEEKARLVQGSANTSIPTTKFEQVWNDAKLLVEEFSGTGTVEDLQNKFYELFQVLREDAAARQYLWEVRTYTKEMIQNPALLDNEAKANQGRILIDQGRIIFQGYRPLIQPILDSARIILTNIKNDSARQDFTSKLQRFGADFALDEQGRPDLFIIQESLGQMKSVLIPILTKQLANLPIPKVSGSNNKYDFSIDGLLLHIGDLLPDFVNLKTKTDTRMDVHRLASEKKSTKIVMEIEQIRALFQNIQFMYHRKKMPKLHDEGIADVDLSQGTGISIKMVWKMKSLGNAPYQIELMQVKCNISRLAITIKDAKHNVIDKLATKLFAGTIKKQIAQAIVNNITKAIQPLGNKLNELFRKKPMDGLMNRANEQMKTSLFTHHEGPSNISNKMSDIKNNITNSVKTAFEPSAASMNNQPIMNNQTPMMVETRTVAPNDAFVGKPLSLTFSEKARRDWLFAWYANNYQEGVYPSMTMPSSHSNNTSDYSSSSIPSMNANGVSIPVTSTESTYSIPITNIEKNDGTLGNQEPMLSK